MAVLRYMSGKQLSAQRSERAEKLELIARQVAAGELVIRQATSEERERYGIGVPRATPPPPRRRPRGASLKVSVAADWD